MRAYTDELAVLSLLYVEDDRETREMVSRMLLRKIPGLRLQCAGNGADGLEIYGREYPDIVLTDIRMPVMDGITMAAGIRELNPEALIIAVTAHNDTDYLMKAIEIGISQYVLKPLNYNRLFAAIDRCSESVALKRRLENQKRHIGLLSRAVEENPCSIIITDATGIITYVNPTFSRLTGYSAEEAIGRTPRILKSGNTPPETYRDLWETVTAGRQWRGEFLNRKKSGEVYWESASISPITAEDGEITSFVAVTADISERKRFEESIEVLNTSLAARSFELEAANRELEEFNSMVSHDLRRPLTNINTYCQVIMEIYRDSMARECVGYLEGIYDETIRMSQLIDTLLSFSAMLRSKPQLRMVDLSRMAASVAGSLQQAEPERNVIVQIEPEISVMGDPKLLRVVLENLLGNAWKYTANREMAVIRFGGTESEEETICFVQDNGIGFDSGEAEKIFHPFQRAENAREYRGHGIGLATVAKIIRHHGGKLRAEGEKGVGATFYFTLPA